MLTGSMKFLQNVTSELVELIGDDENLGTLNIWDGVIFIK